MRDIEGRANVSKIESRFHMKEWSKDIPHSLNSESAPRKLVKNFYFKLIFPVKHQHEKLIFLSPISRYFTSIHHQKYQTLNFWPSKIQFLCRHQLKNLFSSFFQFIRVYTFQVNLSLILLQSLFNINVKMAKFSRKFINPTVLEFYFLS